MDPVSFSFLITRVTVVKTDFQIFSFKQLKHRCWMKILSIETQFKFVSSLIRRAWLLRSNWRSIFECMDINNGCRVYVTICITLWAWRWSLRRVDELGKFEFWNTCTEGCLYLFSDIVYRANFQATFHYTANSFSWKFIILNDISCEYSHGLQLELLFWLKQ